MFPTKCQGQNHRMGRTVISCFHQHLDFSIWFAIKISYINSPFLRFLCLVYSFYTRYVPCMYNISNISNSYPICPIYPADTSAHFEFFSGRTRQKSTWEAIVINVPTPYLGYILDIVGFQGCISLEHLSPMQSYCTECPLWALRRV